MAIRVNARPTDSCRGRMRMDGFFYARFQKAEGAVRRGRVLRADRWRNARIGL
ncbi:MAG: hypothetical protein M3461_00865 [Pseudomonadota bacterium]|nr:hypothetical protein [Pseudomonadota bacterium]